MSESVERSLLKRRSVRRYKREDINPEDLDFIREAVRNTPTSYNGQQFSVIEVTDQTLKEELAAITGQKQLKTAAIDFLFLSDFNKMDVASNALGLSNPHFENTADGLMVGVIDASLAMMGAIVACEARDLGCCPIGYARTADPARIAQLFELPQGVFLVCGLAVGIPAEMPDMKPKQPMDLCFFKNRYGVGGMAQKLLDYNQLVIRYHQTRSTNKSDEDWAAHILEYYREGMGYDMLAFLRQQGYGMKS